MSPLLHAFYAQTADGQAAQNPIAAFLPFRPITLPAGCGARRARVHVGRADPHMSA